MEQHRSVDTLNPSIEGQVSRPSNSHNSNIYRNYGFTPRGTPENSDGRVLRRASPTHTPFCLFASSKANTPSHMSLGSNGTF